MINITEVSGRAFFLPGDDIDTDRIIPARFMKCVTFKEIGPHVFEDARKAEIGKHPFDLPGNRGRNILLVGRNFGSGSSREHAPQALLRWGIQAIIGLSFADIFRGNATAIGLVCCTVSGRDHARTVSLIAEEAIRETQISLNNKKMIHHLLDLRGSWAYTINLPDAHQKMLMDGTWDQLGTLLEAGPAIDAVEKTLPPVHREIGGAS